MSRLAHGCVEAVVSGVAQTKPGLLGMHGLLGAAGTASGMFGTLRSVLNSAFDVPGARSFVRGKVVDLVSMLGVLGLVVVSIAATTLLGLFRAGADHLASGVLPALAWELAYFLSPFGLSFVTFLGGAVVLLVFVYVASSIVIFAAELTSELVKDRARADERELVEQAGAIERELLATLRLPALHGIERPGLPITKAST